MFYLFSILKSNKQNYKTKRISILGIFRFKRENQLETHSSKKKLKRKRAPIVLRTNNVFFE